MIKKLSALSLILITLAFVGCKDSRRIENAAVIENVSVDRGGEGILYTFYLLGSGDKPRAVSVPAASFEEACALAEEAYIPNLSLAKLELLMLSEDVYREVMRTDVEYISTQSSFSPIAYVTLCDREPIRSVEKDSEVQRLIERQLVLLKKNNPSVCVDYLSIFNNLERKGEEGFDVAQISSKKELKVSEMHIYSKNIPK